MLTPRCSRTCRETTIRYAAVFLTGRGESPDELASDAHSYGGVYCHRCDTCLYRARGADEAGGFRHRQHSGGDQSGHCGHDVQSCYFRGCSHRVCFALVCHDAVCSQIHSGGQVLVEALNTVSYVFIGIGLFFNFVGAFGLHRFPDVYTRLHAATKCTTFGAIFLILAVIMQSAGIWAQGGTSQSVMCIHSVLALVALLVTNATGAHAMARAAHRSGEKP